VARRLERLKARRDFLRVAGVRRKWAAPGLILQVAETPDAGETASATRVGFTASKKVGNAVSRNRARRRLRAAAAELLPDHAREGHDFVLIARMETIDRPYHLLLGDLATGLRRLKVWRE
jgi:ribonuclease P protein component